MLSLWSFEVISYTTVKLIRPIILLLKFRGNYVLGKGWQIRVDSHEIQIVLRKVFKRSTQIHSRLQITDTLDGWIIMGPAEIPMNVTSSSKHSLVQYITNTLN